MSIAEQEQLILDYIAAGVNLYGYLPFEKMIEIYNMQIGSPLTMEDLLELTADEDVCEKLEENFALIGEEAFISDFLETEESIERLKQQTADKPYYIPEQQEFLRYKEDMYYERTAEQQALKQKLHGDFSELTDEEIEDAAAELVVGIAISEGDLGSVLAEFVARMDMTHAQAESYVPLIISVANTTRLWENRGHTPKELNPSVGLPAASQKVNRNSPCPCGSGKKYKKCCGK